MILMYPYNLITFHIIYNSDVAVPFMYSSLIHTYFPEISQSYSNILLDSCMCCSDAVAYSSPVNSEVLAYYCLRAGKSHECYLIIQIFSKPGVFISPWDTFRVHTMFFTLNPLWTIPDIYWYTIDIWSTPG